VNRPGPDWVFVGLGGNLGTQAEILARFDDACAQLRTRAAAGGVLERSPVYRSPPAGPVREQPDFLNQVATFPPAPGLEPRPLLELLQSIETHHGRHRDIAQGPRTLDLDLLLFGPTILLEPDLIVPHPRIATRPFVLAPLLALLEPTLPVEKL
jgi:2-amino-4-hydroxy-6-hydroxymethyldihydropteridine diphosphokinase